MSVDFPGSTGAFKEFWGLSLLIPGFSVVPTVVLVVVFVPLTAAVVWLAINTCMPHKDEMMKKKVPKSLQIFKHFAQE